MNVTASQVRKILSRKTVQLAILCVLAAGMNVALSVLARDVLRLPLFLDTVFTAAIAFAAGLVPGMIVAVLTMLPPMIYYHTINYFVLCSIAEVALICALKPVPVVIVRYASKEKISASYAAIAAKLVVLYIACALGISVLGGVIDTLTRFLQESHSPWISVIDVFKPALIMNNLPDLAVNILARIPTNMVDRFIVIFGGYAISRLIVKHV
ncbi:MAG: hypothetical protein LBH44_11295 [Treponema sp.]|jgi:hypothetical protein|nr:hypothetical protein [Treponema sp.]